MKITTVLFDLDGTLLPMDQEAFVNRYLALLAAKMAPHGYDPQEMGNAIWLGTRAMFENDGHYTNEDAFWQTFCGLFGADSRKDEPLFREFYEQEFIGAKAACGFNPKAAEAIAHIRAKGYRLALATNPLFPAIATHNRVRWAGLSPEDFELITTYEDTRHCKPNPAYYQDVCDALGVDPRECLMVGNDATEDTAAEALGIRIFLLTDCLINRKHTDISPYPSGSFPELIAYIDSL